MLSAYDTPSPHALPRNAILRSLRSLWMTALSRKIPRYARDDKALHSTVDDDRLSGYSISLGSCKPEHDLRDLVRRFSTLPFASPDRVRHVLAEHEQILAALEHHDPEAAQRASDQHLQAAREYIVRLELRDFKERALR